MRRNQILISLAAATMILSSCSSKLGALSADNFSVIPNPLETQAGEVPSTVNGMFPEKYLKKKAVVTVTPQLRSKITSNVVDGEGATFQGEKVLGNDQTISYRLGGRYNMKTSFAYTPDMQSSDMYLTFQARIGKKTVKVPDVKVATGVIATSELYKQILANGGGCIAPDSFQRVRQQKQEANIKFLVNQANIRKSELASNSISEFVNMLKKINADREGLNVQNVEVAAYASPEGGFDFNDRLANKRQNVSEDYVRQQLKQTNVEAGIDAHYTAQDWEGFKQLVAASNIQDKDVIIRVLDMYKDPQEREQQIRNMSAGFRELADGVLPELRRARLTINYEVIGRSDDQIQQQYKDDASKLSADELLYAATLEDDLQKQEDIYKTTAKLYPNDYRPLNNLAVIEMAKGNEAAAKEYISRALGADNKAAEAYANRGLISLKNGIIADAETDIARASGANSIGEALGNLNIAKGNYAQAEADFGGIKSNSAALAQLLNKNYGQAIETLDAVDHPDAMTSYLHAIVAARKGNKFAAKSYLEEALQKDPSLKTYADNDLELNSIK
ncbi:MAG: hypothetical protein IJ196_01575 [Prevotella sp.]|nr:hypothetical protein [Prevotella sp.]